MVEREKGREKEREREREQKESIDEDKIPKLIDIRLP